MNRLQRNSKKDWIVCQKNKPYEPPNRKIVGGPIIVLVKMSWSDCITKIWQIWRLKHVRENDRIKWKFLIFALFRVGDAMKKRIINKRGQQTSCSRTLKDDT